MKTLAWLGTFMLMFSVAFATDASTTNTVAIEREKLFQRFIAEMRKNRESTNTLSINSEPAMRLLFDQAIVHPSFGFLWDEVPSPTLKGPNSMTSVYAFIATNGWNMHTGGLVISYGFEKPQPIRGLPWEAIKDREFPALTHNGILYVVLKGWHHNLSGVAYNPITNIFPPAIRGFKPLGEHWYVWAQPEDPIDLPRQYEGQKK